LALLVDGLQAEREQGITIDVATGYSHLKKRKFIIADTLGHEQYTRNMANRRLSCDLAIILIDAPLRRGKHKRVVILHSALTWHQACWVVGNKIKWVFWLIFSEAKIQ